MSIRQDVLVRDAITLSLPPEPRSFGVAFHDCTTKARSGWVLWGEVNREDTPTPFGARGTKLVGSRLRYSGVTCPPSPFRTSTYAKAPADVTA